ncbi:hypothetical protein HZB90_01035, partial [archaeon]|nr:hypothetical protein [archaeon]
MEETAFPVVMTANDPFEKKMSDLRKITELIEFSPLQYTDTFEILKFRSMRVDAEYETGAVWAKA